MYFHPIFKSNFYNLVHNVLCDYFYQYMLFKIILADRALCLNSGGLLVQTSLSIDYIATSWAINLQKVLPDDNDGMQ